MKKAHLLVSFLLIMSLGCAAIIETETEFKPWRGNNSFIGQGGTVEVYGGIEFWEFGDPDKPYRIIGVIRQSKKDTHGHRMLFEKFNRNQIVKLVNQAQGDGIVKVKDRRFISGYDTQHPMNEYDNTQTTAEYSKASVLAVFKYLDANSQ